MNVLVNGQSRELPGGSSVADAVRLLMDGAGGSGVAAALNDDVVPRSGWADALLTDGDRVEILTAVQGG